MLLSFFFKQKTAYEMRISDWSSDVCSSDLALIAWPSGSIIKHGRRKCRKRSSPCFPTASNPQPNFAPSWKMPTAFCRTGSRSGTTWPNVALSVTVPAPSSPAWRAGAVSERIENLAERILNAAGSSLRHYTMQSTRGAILEAVRGAYMAGWKDGYEDALDTEKGEG